MELPNIQALLERSIYHALRTTIVQAGYLPDILLYDIENEDSSVATIEQQRYDIDLDIIREQKGFAIEIFNNSPGQAKGTLKLPRIIIETEAFLPGQLGLDTTLDYLKQPDGNYIAEHNNFLSQTSDFYFHVKLLSNTTKQQRALYGIMLMTLPRRGYMKWYNTPPLPYQNLFVNFTTHSEFNLQDEGITEKSYRYEITDVHELDPVLLENIPAIKEIGTDNIDIQFE